MQNPSHPGESLREICLVRLNLRDTDAAVSLDVGRNTLSAILNGRKLLRVMSTLCWHMEQRT